MSEHGYITVTSGMYDIGEQYGLPKVEAKKLIKVFNESAWMGYLKAFRDARSGVAKLYEHGYRFHCITSLSLDQKAKRLRAYNLENVFGKGTFKELVCLDTGADKDDAPSEITALYYGQRAGAGLIITEQPAASAGAIFQTAIIKGKFHGTTPATIPIGSFTIKLVSDGSVGPTFPKTLSINSPYH